MEIADKVVQNTEIVPDRSAQVRDNSFYYNDDKRTTRWLAFSFPAPRQLVPSQQPMQRQPQHYRQTGCQQQWQS